MPGDAMAPDEPQTLAGEQHRQQLVKDRGKAPVNAVAPIAGAPCCAPWGARLSSCIDLVRGGSLPLGHVAVGAAMDVIYLQVMFNAIPLGKFVGIEKI